MCRLPRNYYPDYKENQAAFDSRVEVVEEFTSKLYSLIEERRPALVIQYTTCVRKN